MTQKRILLVDDDISIHQLVEVYLKNEGFQVLHAYDGTEVLQMVQKHRIHLVILDTMMPKMDGLETCVQLRKEVNIPIIFLTAKGEDMDIIQGLTLGADDYVTKPFQPLELVARVKSQLRRYLTLQGAGATQSKDEILVDELLIQIPTHIVKVKGKEITLTRREFAILALLAQNGGIVFSMQDIYERVWGEPFVQNENTVMVHIRKIREKIEENPKKPYYIQTVWGVGYKFRGK